ncbi:MAG: riboflavin biosynthesis protein RibF [Magnetococcales bacterium]|nr:riboflavin biosynthesis protein RibF [Magnetococcales bacterium]
MVAIGNFDGVHRGHQSLLSVAVRLAKEQAVPAVAITFEPHPRALLQPEAAPERLTSLSGKIRCLAQQQLDGLLLLRFTPVLAQLSAEQFVTTVLVRELAIRTIVVGYNFRFGQGGRGHIDTLEGMGKQHGFSVYQPEAARADGDIISSTRIRKLIRQGELAAASQLLGWPFEIAGRVQPGDQRGRTLGYPTANLSLTGLVHPPVGVYSVAALVEGNSKWQPAVANLGHNPTFGRQYSPRLEIHLLQPLADPLYGRKVRVRLYHRLRDERIFPNIQALQQQIADDITQTRRYFDHNPLEVE